MDDYDDYELGEGRDHVAEEIENLEFERNELLTTYEALLDTVRGMSGSNDFSPGGIAHQSWLKAQPAIDHAVVVIAAGKGD